MKKAISQYEKMTETPVSKLIVSLSIPTVISMLVTNIYNLADSAFVGTISTSASGAVGIVFGFMSIMQAIGFTFGQGSGSIVSRLLGAKDNKEASVIASTGFICSFTIATIVAVLCAIFIKPLIYFLGGSDTIFPYAKTYISYLIVSAPFMVSCFVLNNILRFEGKALFGMIGLLSGSLINIAGDAILMFVFDLGIVGAAISTCVSQILSFIFLFIAFLSGKTTSKLSIKYFSFNIFKIGNIIGTGFPSLLRQGLNSISTILLNLLAKPYGDAAIAAMSIVNRIFFFFFSVAVGIGQGFQPVCGFNYGAKRFDRVKKGFKFTLLLTEIIILVFSTIVLIKAEFFTRLLRNDDLVVQIASYSLRLECIASLFLPFSMITEMMLQSSGHKVSASVLSAARGGVIFIPLLFILTYFRGLKGIQEAQPLAFFLTFFPAFFFEPRFMKEMDKKANYKTLQMEELKHE